VAANEIHKDDIGTQFQLTVYTDTNGTILDISYATIIQIIFEKPDGTLITQDASFLTDGTDGILVYTSVSGDLNQVGKWKIQARLSDGGANDTKTDIVRFNVHENLG